MTKCIESSHKYIVTYDRDKKKIQVQNDLTNTSTIKNSNIIDCNETNMFSKVSSVIKSHIFDKFAMNHVIYYSAYKCDNLIFMESR